MMSVDSSSSSIASKQNTSSPGWAYFGVKVDKGGTTTDDGVVICRVCNTAVKVRGSNTSNLVLHLKVHHPLKHVEVVKKQEMKYGSSSKSVSLEQTNVLVHLKEPVSMSVVVRMGMNSQIPSHSA